MHCISVLFNKELSKVKLGQRDQTRLGERLDIVYPRFLKDALSDLRQFLATENPLKIMKNAFHSP